MKYKYTPEEIRALKKYYETGKLNQIFLQETILENLYSKYQEDRANKLQEYEMYKTNIHQIYLTNKLEWFKSLSWWNCPDEPSFAEALHYSGRGYYIKTLADFYFDAQVELLDNIDKVLKDSSNWKPKFRDTTILKELNIL